MVRTAHYLRISYRVTAGRGISIPDQLARLRAASAAAEECVVATFIDQARSGTSAAKRPEYQKLLAAARRREFDRVRVEGVDRGHRNDIERRAFEAEMQALGIQVLYNGEPERQAPQQRKLQRGMRGVMAEWEADETSQRTYKRHVYRAKQGKWRGGPWPFDVKPDGHDWFEPDPACYDVLLWLLARRAEGWGYHAIARALNQGISLDGETLITPFTPGLLAYQRRPYLVRQDPETGDEIRLERPIPSGAWRDSTVQGICRAAVDGVYAGILSWGKRQNRFSEDDEGNPKKPIRVETQRFLVPVDLLRRVQAVELAAQEGEPATLAAFNTFLLSHQLRCGLCGQAMHGYTSTKYKKDKDYKYRKYRCAGRVNTPGACQMPILSADDIEQAVLEAVFADVQQQAPGALLEEINAAIARRRNELLDALALADQQLTELAARRTAALDALTDRTLSGVVRQAMIEHAEGAVRAHEELQAQQRTLRAGIEALDTQARTIALTLTSPFLDPARWQEPEAQMALKRALRLLVHKLVLIQEAPGVYVVQVWMYEFRESLFHESTCFR